MDGADESPLTRAFQVSLDALPAAPRRLFALLGLVPGPDFTARGCAALLGAPVPEAARLLRRLAAAHLVEQHVPGRYRQHDLVRDFARAQPAEPGAWDRLVAFHLAAVDAVDGHFSRHPLRLPRESAPACVVGFADSAEAVAWLEAEQDNLTALLRQAAVQGPHPTAWYLADAIRSVFLHRGLRAEWLAVAVPVLAAARGVPRVEALMLQSIGAACVHLGRRQEAVRHLEAALAAHRRCRWPEGEAATVNSLGIALLACGRLGDAADLFTRALALETANGSPTGRMMALNNLGFVHRQLGELAEAIGHLDLALELSARERSSWGEAVARVNLGYVRRLLGDPAGAREHLLAACALHRGLGNRYGEASALVGLSVVHADLGQHAQARADAEAALAVARQEANRDTEVGALTALGRALAASGSVVDAEALHRQAVEIARRWGSPWHVAEASAGLCVTLGLRGLPEASVLAAETLALARGHRIVLADEESLLALA
ncbi:Transcriptional regulator [Saccharothrix espanaensis DSM 44229]|uniref:Transcriptional regulator n=1 Tax=Saccharothrix espanaensis (strain ATCC 51144 / DSM 44229 / JCM 9112 / NBRC 15066 / NRRL 15764) TaxID=1179773 RepID=K0JRN4_SACES|nr:Transcriptional regulator [Saccharothrix espanaensis DSM 44229]